MNRSQRLAKHMLAVAKQSGSNKEYESIRLSYEQGYIEPAAKDGKTGWILTDAGKELAKKASSEDMW